MSIMDIFRTAPSQPAATPAQSTTPVGPGNPGTGNPGNIPNPGEQQQGAANVPPTTPPASTSNAPESPLDKFGEIWKIDPNAATANTNPLFTVDAAKFQEAAAKVDFTKVITPEMMQSIQGGGENAAKAFAEGMNKVAQQVYAQNAFATTKIVEQALNKSTQQLEGNLPSMIKKLQLGSDLRNSNAVFKNPAVEPIIQALESQLVVKYPNATQAELTAMAQDYITNFASSVAPANKNQNSNSASESQDEDWGKFFS